MHAEYERFRQMKDEFFARQLQSPLTPEQKASFDGLKYFPVDDDLRMDLDADEFEEKDIVELQTSTGDVQTYERWGKIRFEVDGQLAELTVFSNQHGLFLPFADATSGKESYGAGRYLEPESLPGGKVRVDFNLAYTRIARTANCTAVPFHPLKTG